MSVSRNGVVAKTECLLCYTPRRESKEPPEEIGALRSEEPESFQK